MAGKKEPIPPEEWRAIVANVPIVSVDLVVEHNGGVLLGKRKNEPVEGEWFVPGGTVFKNESRTEAAHRVAEEELGESIVIDECLGTFEHFYESADVDGVDSKHYVATAYRCHFDSTDPQITSDDQHDAFKIVRPPYGAHHPYVKRYLKKV